MMKRIMALIMALLLLSAMTVCAFATNGADAASYSYSDYDDYDYDDYDDGELNLAQMIIISLVIGVVIGLIVAFALKAQLKSVRKRYTAHEYVREGSVNIRRLGDFYLYRNVVRTKRQNNNKR